MANCSLMCLVGFGVCENAVLSTSSCFALIVVRGPLRLLLPLRSSGSQYSEEIAAAEDDEAEEEEEPLADAELLPLLAENFSLSSRSVGDKSCECFILNLRRKALKEN